MPPRFDLRYGHLDKHLFMCYSRAARVCGRCSSDLDFLEKCSCGQQHDESLQCRQDTTEQLIRSVSQTKEGGKAAFLL